MATPRRLSHRPLDGLGDCQVTLAEGATATVHGDVQPRVRVEVHRPAFCYCEDGFRELAISGAQMLFAMPGYRGPVRLPAQEAA